MLTALPRMLGRYRRQYPQVDLRLRELYTAGLVDTLLNGTLDIGFMRDAGDVEGLRVETLAAGALCGGASAEASVWPQQKTVAVKSLQHEPFVLFARSYGEHGVEENGGCVRSAWVYAARCAGGSTVADHHEPGGRRAGRDDCAGVREAVERPGYSVPHTRPQAESTHWSSPTGERSAADCERLQRDGAAEYSEQ